MTTPRTITMYGIPNCDTVKKARTWLDEHGINFVFHNFKKDGLTKSTVETWLTDSDLATLINRKGTTWRALSDADKLRADDTLSAISLMVEQSSVIKRPVLVIDHGNALKVHVGFSTERYQALFS
ncbi:arsenate reductase [Undibacterium cyanobacteriorum]|uniref:Arsenate reductase n=1 Tax=Undibacterium cyanobacteriorum TaxID=3073561 RepID=A0ABY9RQA2_9BURK|nr:arsenate reductase [Undibacterium sp. 20NA77.5]WMW82420.1 arsenate reductase [Undibacterium sp. 20NA77.5]